MMKTSAPSIPARTDAIAQRVLADIRNRGLVSGDRYITAEEAREFFGVGKNLLNDALKLLADQGMLVRKQRSGTFVGPSFQMQSPSVVRETLISIVHVLMPMGYYRSNVIPGNVFVDQLTRAVPACSVQIHHVADKDLTAYTLNLVNRLVEGGVSREALVLLRSTREAQLAVQSSGLPAVVFGSTYPDVKQLSSIDPDQALVGRLAVQAALQRGHRQFALIMRNNWRRGDNLLMEGMSQALGEAGIGIDQVRVLSTAEDEAVIEHDVAELLVAEPGPTALICRSRVHAAAAAKSVREHGMDPAKDMLVICAEASSTNGDGKSDLAVVPSISAEKQVAQIGELLKAIADPASREIRCIKVPVHVEEPGAASPVKHKHNTPTTGRSPR